MVIYFYLYICSFVHLPPRGEPLWLDLLNGTTTCLGTIPAFNGIKEGSDLKLIPEVELECVESRLC